MSQLLRRARSWDPARVLLTVVVIDIVFAAVVRGRDITELFGGARDWIHWAALVGGAWILVVLVVAGWAVTHLLATRRAGSASEARFHSLAAQSVDWIWQSTPDLVLTYSSPGVEGLLGYRPEDLVGRSLYELMAPQERPRAARIAAGARETQAGWSHTEIRWRHADGHLVSLTGTSSPVLSGAGNVIAFQGVRGPSESPRAASARRREIQQRIGAVLEAEDLKIAFQPIIDMGAGRWCGVEALARFGAGTPDRWFAEAAEVGLGPELECLAVSTALGRLAELPDDIYVSVNVSPSTILAPGFSQMLSEHRASLGRVVLELTEHAGVADYDELTGALEIARFWGARVAVDDTGAGYASFQHVLRLRPQIIKIDRSLVAGLAVDRAKQAVVRSVCSLADELDAVVVAEGVETAAEVVSARAAGVTVFQGYFFGRPSIEAEGWSQWADGDLSKALNER